MDLKHLRQIFIALLLVARLDVQINYADLSAPLFKIEVQADGPSLTCALAAPALG